MATERDPELRNTKNFQTTNVTQKILIINVQRKRSFDRKARKNEYKILVGKRKEIDHSEDQGVDRKTKSIG
jgi:hypothetical protein